MRVLVRFIHPKRIIRIFHHHQLYLGKLVKSGGFTRNIQIVFSKKAPRCKNVHFKGSDPGAGGACGGLNLWRGLDVDVDVDIDRPIRSFGVSEFLI